MLEFQTAQFHAEVLGGGIEASLYIWTWGISSPVRAHLVSAVPFNEREDEVSRLLSGMLS